MRLSIIIPVFNAAKSIEALVGQLSAVLVDRYAIEIVLVNDGSRDDASGKICMHLANTNRCVIFVDLARNFGEHNAVMAGLAHCSGDAAVIIDDDFQNPPSEIPKLVQKLEEGFDVAYSAYAEKKHSLFRNLGSKLANQVANLVIDKPSSLYLSSFKAINRFVIDEIIKYRGPYPYVDGLILRITHNCAQVRVRHDPRLAGVSGYTFAKLASLWLSMFTNFSIIPLRIATVMGFTLAMLGVIGAILVVIERLSNPSLPTGWASTIVTLLTVSGVQLLAVGMLGEYLGRLFMKENGNPQYVVRRTVNYGAEQRQRR